MNLLSLVAAAAGGLLVVLGTAELFPGVLAWRSRRAPVVLLVLSAALALPAGAAPTGLPAWDAVLRVGFGAGVVWATTRARRNTVVVACVVAAAGGGPLVLAAVGAAAGSALAGTRSRVVGASVGLLLAQGLLRLGDVGPSGTTAALGAVATTIVAVSGLRRGHRRTRRRVAQVALATVVVAGLASAAALVVAVRARASVEVAIHRARAGLDAARDDDQERAATLLGEADDDFRAAHRTLGAWWARPAMVVPVAAQQLRALEQLSGSGAELAASGADAATRVDPSAVRPRGGVVDVRALQAMRAPLDGAFDALTRARRRLARLDSPWLLPPVADRLDELAGRIDDVYGEAQTAAMAADLGPALLGADGPRRYLLLVVTPSELRGSGGIIGNFGEIDAAGGKLTLARLERIDVLNDSSPPGIQNEILPAELLARYEAFGLGRFWQNLTLSPSYPIVAAAAERLYPASGGRRIDGVISVDPIGLAGLLKLTGPVQVDGAPEPLTADNAARVLLFDQYASFGEDPARIDFLGTAARRVWGALTSGELPGPAKLADVLGPLVRGRHLQLHSVHEAEQRFFAHIDADGALPPVVHDALTVVTQNASRTKIDWFLRRSVDDDVRYDPTTGAVTATVDVELRNLAPAGGLPAVVIGPPEVGALTAGQSLLYVSIYTPLGLRGATVDGKQMLMESDRELGRNAFSAFVLVEPQSTTTVRLELAGTIAARDVYRLDLGRQPTVAADDVHVRVRAGGTVAERRLTLDRARTVRVAVR